MILYQLIQNVFNGSILIFEEGCHTLSYLIVRLYANALHRKTFGREVGFAGWYAETNAILGGEIFGRTTCVASSLFSDQCRQTTLFKVYGETLGCREGVVACQQEQFSLVSIGLWGDIISAYTVLLLLGDEIFCNQSPVVAIATTNKAITRIKVNILFIISS